jgi:hypothetical protein
VAQRRWRNKESLSANGYERRLLVETRPEVPVGEGRMAFMTAPTRNGSITMAMKHINTMDIVESL